MSCCQDVLPLSPRQLNIVLIFRLPNCSALSGQLTTWRAMGRFLIVLMDRKSLCTTF